MLGQTMYIDFMNQFCALEDLAVATAMNADQATELAYCPVQNAEMLVEMQSLEDLLPIKFQILNFGF